MHDYYNILGVQQDAPIEIIKAVYHAWMHGLSMHPDKGGDVHTAALINEAYAVLKDKNKRYAYDQSHGHCVASKTSEHRRSPRFNISGQLMFIIPDTDQIYSMDVIDASPLGLRARMSVALARNMHISIMWTKDMNYTTEAYVRWLRSYSTIYDCGIEFFKPVPDIIKKIGT